jgi:hypothetical protein
MQTALMTIISSFEASGSAQAVEEGVVTSLASPLPEWLYEFALLE